MLLPSRRLAVTMACALCLLACGDSGSDPAGADSPAPADDAGDATGDTGASPEDAGPTAADATADADAADVDPGDAGPDAEPGPEPWPFALDRTPAGEPLTQAEITDFTREITGFWKDSQYFRWVRLHSHGLDPSNPMGQFDYALWWQDTQASKAGGAITFTHTGRADNLTLRTCKVLNNTIAGYLAFGDEDLGWLTRQYSRGLAALSKAMDFGPDDPAPYLQARALFTHDHAYETVGGRQVAVEYGPIKKEEESWNAKIIHNPTNPTWGDIWFVNQRSKDDLPHMFRSVPMLLRAAAEAPDAETREAAELGLEYLRGFARDVVDQGYQIRTKFEDGEAVVPTKDNGTVKDLASFVLFEGLIPNAECIAKLGAALVAYDEPLDNECGLGLTYDYEDIATGRHYFNYAIVRYFHIAAAANALVRGHLETSRELLVGLGLRADRILHDAEMPHFDNDIWWSDAAAFLLASAASGLPLTHEEARLVHEQYLLTAAHYAPFEYWDPWDSAVPDGPFDYKPHRGVAVRPTEIGYLLEYCASDWRHPDSAPLVDCDVVLDPSQWGL